MTILIANKSFLVNIKTTVKNKEKKYLKLYRTNEEEKNKAKLSFLKGKTRNKVNQQTNPLFRNKMKNILIYRRRKKK